ncbi:TPA: hypothetical protein DEG21_01135 [Patescibacteria group bacterium]|nr:hypothetical protein [Candidatus Gracilibacteria bacterium]HBY74507.1 hypothetical protein [Candidatus Gracilibacteria bacterium]
MSDELLILDSKQEETKKEQTSFGLDKINEWLLEQQKINLKSKVVFFRLLATMVNAGISVLKSITILEKQEKNLVLKKLYTNIID